jgi:hypothetical protein
MVALVERGVRMLLVEAAQVEPLEMGLLAPIMLLDAVMAAAEDMVPQTMRTEAQAGFQAEAAAEVELTLVEVVVTGVQVEMESSGFMRTEI